MICDQCPRKCNIDRDGGVGFCRTGNAFSVARISRHAWEEPIISGKNGSGTVFFSGCNLRCVFCQNRAISRGDAGQIMSADELSDAMLRLVAEGAQNVNLVTPSHYTRQLVPLLEKIKPRLGVPVVWNSSGYESVDSLRMLDGLVDVYLPDMKYFSPTLSAAYSSAPDYFEVAVSALTEMLRQTGAPRFSADGTALLGGTVVRHLVLPGERKDSIALLRTLHERFGSDAFLLSLMCQYTPDFAMDTPYKNLHRRLTSFEYDSVLALASDLGFVGFSQDLSSASAAYTPDF
ncbi:MAG: radical SAM protein [Clostridia bacterium]|nr:radical SAM protein [Clostridia bacterium]